MMIPLPRLIICISLLGVYFMNHRHDKRGFLFFATSAALWTWYDVDLGIYEQAMTNAASSIVSIYGYIKWRKDGL